MGDTTSQSPRTAATMVAGREDPAALVCFHFHAVRPMDERAPRNASQFASGNPPNGDGGWPPPGPGRVPV
jgi:hypothetical protein